MDELAKKQLEGLLDKARDDFDNGLDVEIYGGPIRFPVAHGPGVHTMAAVAEDAMGVRRVYAWLPAAGTSGVWYERPDLDPDYITGMLAWGEQRESRNEEAI